MAANEIQIFVARIVLLGKAASHCALVQSVPNRLVRHLRQTTDARYVVKFVYIARVSDKRTAAGKLFRYSQRQRAT